MNDRMDHCAAYRAPWWLPGGNVQTLYAALVAGTGRRMGFRRERWSTPDGDFVDVDHVDGPADAPLVVLFHGLEGGSRSHYARALAAGLRDAGWRGAVPHFRGCSGEPNRLARAYHSGDSAEIGWMLERFATLAANAAVAAVGVSLGGNALLKWLGESGASAAARVSCAAAISAPLDLPAAGDCLAGGFNRLYSRVFLSTLKKKSAAKAVVHPGLFDAHAAKRSRTLREFDNAVTAPLHGFRDTDHYWSDSSSKPWLAHIGVPTLVLNARNDPFMPASALPSHEQVSPLVQLEFPEEGGHAGFVNGPFPGGFGWLRTRIISFIRAHLPRT
jgi:predicted alpha/beta-fold hydrolase